MHDIKQLDPYQAGLTLYAITTKLRLSQVHHYRSVASRAAMRDACAVCLHLGDLGP
jgi:hypothetical protein